MASRFSFDRRQKTIDHDGSVASYEDPWTGESTPYNPTPLWVTMQRLRVPKLSSSQDAFRHTFWPPGRYIAFFVFLSDPLFSTPYTVNRKKCNNFAIVIWSTNEDVRSFINIFRNDTRIVWNWKLMITDRTSKNTNLCENQFAKNILSTYPLELFSFPLKFPRKRYYRRDASCVVLSKILCAFDARETKEIFRKENRRVEGISKLRMILVEKRESKI